MATPSKYDQVAEGVLRAVGGASNVKSVTHCATRLRFQLNDRDKADKAAVEATRGVITVVESAGQFQVVIGNTVNNVYESLTAMPGVAAGEGGTSGGFLAKAIDLITSIFTPFLWILAGSGLLKAFLAVWVKVDAEASATSTYAILFAAGDAIFQFLPILLAITASKRFKANIYTSVAIASALIYSATIAVIPNAEGASVTLQAFANGGGELTFLGIPVVMISYLSAVIPTILAVYAQAHLERLLNRVLPEAIRNFVTPLVTLAVIVPVTFLVIGPISDSVGTGLSSGVNWFWGLSPIIGGALMGAFWQVFVIFGVHWGFVPVMIQDLSLQGYSLLTGPLFAAVLAQSGAAAAVFLKTKNHDLKAVAGPATISAFLAGITEPAIYGVTLRLKKPFIFACIGGAIGGAIAAAGGSAAMGFVLPGAITLTAAMDVGNFTLQLIGTGLAIAIAFTLTMVLGFKDIPNPVEGATDEGTVPSEAAAVAAPVAGQVVPLSAVPDKVFSSGAMGSGLAVLPSEGKAYAPIAGTLVTVMPHAFGIKGDNGLEVLVHVGLDTVELNGKNFTAKVKQGDVVKAGQLLTEFDIEGIKAAGYNPMTVMIVTNSAKYSAVVPVASGDVRANELVLDIVG
ncbi:beta-glucoside-specific PTS transporter subunit IIABC [Actinotalea sp.]|uniref:beta-glucoside-specific PTS transporter subunit IIABC n=1 Tax=Actinotalea sp. TaxID=1872145 RepID=UPI002BF4CF08|nr:beta-glucoside-specific PTS transporter subunit IIABC [Actinotalea sp.]HQY34602.1 beta-glucoside-specific PTS transporter subunit IIABC [Actinotalea sp.]HRA49452.1 beta-glucoside-specific PTS transporter subunit IIABC [Actinotalea sp.]